LTLQYVNCFYDFQEPCITYQSLTRQQRRSRDLNFETETWLKLRDQDFIKKSETQKFTDYAEKFLKIVITTPNLNFANNRHFSYLLNVCYFLPADTADKKYFNFEVVELSFAKPYRCSIQSLKTMVWDRDR